jgi:small-conductance mechanosensitive channel
MSVSYDSDLEKVERVTREVAVQIIQRVPGAIADSQPIVRYNAFGDSGISFNVILRAHDFLAQYAIKHEFIKAVFERYRSENITIPYPTRTVYMKPDTK